MCGAGRMCLWSKAQVDGTSWRASSTRAWHAKMVTVRSRPSRCYARVGERRGVAPGICSPAMALSLDDTRRAYAEEIRAVADIRCEALIEALARVPREDFLGPGPWLVWRF